MTYGPIAWDVPALRALEAKVGWNGVDRERPHFIYRAYDAEGHLLYIGRTRQPWQRFETHGKSSWRPLAARVDWEFVGNYEDAKRAEVLAIANERPSHNRQHYPIRAAALRGGDAA